MKTIYSLGYHEQLALNNDLYVLRVPGGWIYCDKVYQQNTFVPYNDEFKPQGTLTPSMAKEAKEAAKKWREERELFPKTT